MITRHSTQEEISSYIATKTAEFMAIVDETQQVRGRDLSNYRAQFTDSLTRYTPGKLVTVDMCVRWLDGQIAEASRLLDMARARAARA